MITKYVFLLVVGFLMLSMTACSDVATVPVGGTVYGIVVNPDGSRAEGVKIIIEEGGDTIFKEHLYAYTDENGEFIINEVLCVDEFGIGKHYNIRGEGEWEIYVQNQFRTVSAGFVVEQFSVPSQQSYDMGYLLLQPTITMWGRARLADEIDLTTEDHSGTFISVVGYSWDTVSSADGSFYLPDLPPHDNYYVRFEHEGYMPMVMGPIPLRAGIRAQGGVQAILQRDEEE